MTPQELEQLASELLANIDATFARSKRIELILAALRRAGGEWIVDHAEIDADAKYIVCAIGVRSDGETYLYEAQTMTGWQFKNRIAGCYAAIPMPEWKGLPREVGAGDKIAGDGAGVVGAGSGVGRRFEVDQRMTIALDFDGCYDKAPALFNQFIRAARDAGHRVLIVSSRGDTRENSHTIRRFMREQGCQEPLPPIHLTSGAAKKWFLEHHWRIVVDVWVDDDVRCIENGK